MKVNFITPNKYSRPQVALKKHTAIAFTQFTNVNTADEARDYFESLKDNWQGYASVHYAIDKDGNVVQCVPENEITHAVSEANYYSITIGYIGNDITPKMERAALKLCINICNRYDIKKVIRHYDVTGSPFPLQYAVRPQTFAEFKENIFNFKGK